MDDKVYEFVEDQTMTMQQYINNIFKWMVIGVLTTFLTAFALERTSFMAHAGVLPLLLVVFQFAVVIRLSRHLMTMKPATAKALYITYSVITGITFSYVISSYTGFTVSLAFFSGGYLFWSFSYFRNGC